MRLYTGRGDQGSTDLLGARVEKDDPRIELLGTLDEATSAMGLGRALSTSPEVKDAVIVAQRDLYQIMGELAFTDEIRPESMRLTPDRVDWLSETTDRLSGEIDLPRQFILPGDTVGGAALDVARTVARRAERQAVSLAHAGHIQNGDILRYLNRLSSLLFMLARAQDAAEGVIPRKAKATADG